MKECAMTACKQMAKKNSDYCERHSELCLIPGCEEHVRTAGMCNTHYNNYFRKRKRAGKDLLCVYPGCTEPKVDEFFCATHLKVKQEYRKPRECMVPSCGEMSIDGIFCEEHHHIYTQTGKPVRAKEICGIPGCEEPHNLKGMCQKHYAQWMRAHEKFLKGDS